MRNKQTKHTSLNTSNSISFLSLRLSGGFSQYFDFIRAFTFQISIKVEIEAVFFFLRFMTLSQQRGVPAK